MLLLFAAVVAVIIVTLFVSSNDNDIIRPYCHGSLSERIAIAEIKRKLIKMITIITDCRKNIYDKDSESNKNNHLFNDNLSTQCFQGKEKRADWLLITQASFPELLRPLYLPLENKVKLNNNTSIVWRNNVRKDTTLLLSLINDNEKITDQNR